MERERWARRRLWPAIGAAVALAVVGLPPASPAASQASSPTVRDDLGRTVLLPAAAGRIVCLQPEATRILFALGCGDRLVGLDYFLKKHDPVFGRLFPSAAALPVVAYEDASVNTETVLRLGPDLIIASPYDAHVPDALQAKVGKAVLAVSSRGRFDRFLSEVRLLGRVTGAGARAGALEAFFRATLDRIARRVAAVPAERKPRVYLAFWSSLTRTPVAYDPVDAAGGRNVAGELASPAPGSDGAVISLERLLRFDPDIILVHGNYPPAGRSVTVESVLADRRLASVKAVRKGNVFYTFGFWSWWDPAEVLVETLYLARLFHPDLFGDVDLAREGNAIYKAVYGSDGGFAALCRVIECDEWLKR
jgi:iron complex transport system substrate-binding protein